MRLWQAILLALLSRAGAEEEAAPQHRESRDSYLDAYQQSHQPQTHQQQQQQHEHHPSYPVYSAPVPSYGPAKEPAPMTKDPNAWYGVPHFHHHYTVPEPPLPTEMEPDKGHGGFELTTVLKFLLKMIFLKLLVKKIYLIMTLLFLPKIKLLDWLWEKKKKPSKPSKPTKPSASSEEHNDQLEEDDDDMSFFRNSRGLGQLEKQVIGAISKQEELNNNV